MALDFNSETSTSALIAGARDYDLLFADDDTPVYIPEGTCDLCNDPADADMGEFWDSKNNKPVFAHDLCGRDAGMEYA